MADFIPSKRANRRQWLVNISENVVAQAVTMGAPPADAVTVKGLADGLITAYDNTDTAQTAVDGKREIEAQTETSNLAQMRNFIRNWKTLTGYPASGSEAALGLKSSSTAVDPATYKPVIEVSMKGGQITLEFEKKGVEALAFYCRLRGQTAWTRMGTDTYTPFLDSKPLANPAVAEMREYMARGMIDDIEIGLDSDIVAFTYGG